MTPHLKTRDQFQRTFRQGGRAWQEFLQVRYIATEGPTRLGIVLRSNPFRRANRRNRIRRMLQESWRLLEAGIPAGFDVVIVPTAEPPYDHRDCCLAVLARALKRANLYAGPLPEMPDGLKPNRFAASPTARGTA